MTPRCGIHGQFMTLCTVCQSRYCRTCGDHGHYMRERLLAQPGGAEALRDAEKRRVQEPAPRKGWRRLLGGH